MARRCALEALTSWEDTSRHADEILSDLAAKYGLSKQDRALAQEILYGTIRNLFLLDELIDRFRRGSIKPSTQNLLRIGLYQIFRSGIADHAAVNETVGLARKHEKGLVNAILRNALRQRDDLEKEIESWPLEDRFSHPAHLLERWEDQHGRDAVLALCEWNNQPPETYARLNRLADPEALERVLSEVRPTLLEPPCDAFFRFTGPPDPDWLREGLIYVQDPSTSLSCRLLDPQPGESILDACAAPGGKTSLLAALSRDEASIVATDNSSTRLEQTRENLERLGADSVRIRSFDWADPDPRELESFPRFDAILLDVPCSNSGVMRRRVDVRWRLQPGDFSRHAELQLRLLENARRALAPGGRIVYSTCSIDREENEDVVAASGLSVERVVSSLPWRDGFDGAFAALLRA